MIARASGLGMGVHWFSKLLGGVGVLAMPDAGLHSMPPVESVCEVPLWAEVLQMIVSGVAVGVYIDCRSVADVAEVMC